MANIDFESIKERTLATAGKVAGKSAAIARTAGEKAKLVGKITKLKTEIAMEKDGIRKNFIAIGKKYYEQHKHDPHPDMAQAVTEVGVSFGVVNAKKAEVEALKKELADDWGDAVGSVEGAVDDLKDVVTDAAGDVKDAVGDVVETVKEAVNND